jgi:hypothetical protein
VSPLTIHIAPQEKRTHQCFQKYWEKGILAARRRLTRLPCEPPTWGHMPLFIFCFIFIQISNFSLDDLILMKIQKSPLTSLLNPFLSRAFWSFYYAFYFFINFYIDLNTKFPPSWLDNIEKTILKIQKTP